MKSAVLTSTLVLLNTQAVVSHINELKLIDEKLVGQVVKSPLPHTYLKEEDLPESLDYRAQGLLTTDLNQHIPVYCGSCWAHSAFSSLADRIKIGSKGMDRDIIPSVQALINCGNAGDCGGGDSNAANAWVYYHGMPDVTCQQYQAINMECSDYNTCMNCDPQTGCYALEPYAYPYTILEEYGIVSGGDHNIMAEIYARGPVSAYINAYCLEDPVYTGGIVQYDSCDNTTTNHAIQLNGWGTEDGVDYWIGRNSWGTYWGERGFFRIVRGGNYNPPKAYWAVPVIPDTSKSPLLTPEQTDELKQREKNAPSW
jgi:cathepsin X